MNKNKGFTLIELLVVIAIIGILSSVVLASLGTARTKGKTAAVKAAMSQLRSQAELYYDTNGSYGDGTSCSTGVLSDTQIVAIVANITANGATGMSCTSDQASGTNDTKWSVRVVLPDTTNWCIDSSGAAKVSPTNLAGVCA